MKDEQGQDEKKDDGWKGVVSGLGGVAGLRKDDGGPANPKITAIEKDWHDTRGGPPTVHDVHSTKGMTVWDEFFKRIVESMAKAPTFPPILDYQKNSVLRKQYLEHVMLVAGDLADAMIAERKRRFENEDIPKE